MSFMRALGFAAAFVLVLSPLSFAADGKQPVTATDLLKIRQVTSVDVASDGSFAVYGVQSIHTDKAPNGDPTYNYRTHLYSINLNDPAAKPIQLTFGDRRDGDPQISPDRKSVAFVRLDTSNRERPRPQVWLLPLDGAGEAHPITSLENGASSPRWRPDGKAMLVTSAIPFSKLEGTPHFDLERPERKWFDWDREKPGQKVEARPDGDRKAIRNWLEKNASKDNPTVTNRINFLAEQGLAREPVAAHLFLLDVATEKATELTKGFYSAGNAYWSRDGKTIYYVSTPEGAENPDRLRRSSIWTMNADGSGNKVLLDKPTHAFRLTDVFPDGKLLVEATETDQPGFRQSKIARFDPGNGSLEFLAPEWDSSIQQAAYSPQSGIFFATPWQGGVRLQLLSRGKIDNLTPGPLGVGVWSEGGGKVVASLIQVSNPNELYLITLGGRHRKLTDLNTEWLASKELSYPEEHWITQPDGVKVQYWIMNPTNAQAGRKYPFVVDMHGGPTAMWGPGEFSMWHEFQTFTAWGYGVVYCNQRGSSGYGYAHQRAIYRNWGDGPQSDVLKSLEDAEKFTPYIDKDRLFLTGGSYAGYLTAWIVGHDNRFKAAAAQRGVYDLPTFFGEGNAFRLVETHFGGFPWEPEARKILDQQSPVNYSAQIKTPLLILHASEDLRTGVTQSEMLYRALKQQKKPVEYIRYPGSGHELTRSGPPLQRMDHMLRIVEFFERYSKNDRPAPVEAKAAAAATGGQ
jgi:dipeptidyl aminopeptidase/acylaminoacyl peptidase